MGKVDRIERQIVVSAARERVWAAITDPGEVSLWFGDTAEIELKPGGAAKFGWSEYDSVVHAIVEVVEPPTRFVYRWAAAAGVLVDGGSATRVEFTLEEAADGTLVRVVETGFAALPDEFYESTLEDNRSGWRAELRDLGDYLGVRQEVR